MAVGHTHNWRRPKHQYHQDLGIVPRLETYNSFAWILCTHSAHSSIVKSYIQHSHSRLISLSKSLIIFLCVSINPSSHFTRHEAIATPTDTLRSFRSPSHGFYNKKIITFLVNKSWKLERICRNRSNFVGHTIFAFFHQLVQSQKYLGGLNTGWLLICRSTPQSHISKKISVFPIQLSQWPYLDILS